MALYGDAPTSQRDRPISFILDDPGGQFATSLDLVVRPEGLTRAEPSRLAVIQTLGGAWADCWGEGVGTISLEGTTGWRGGADGLDGEGRFLALRDTVFANWHKARLAQIQAGQDPDAVRLTYADALDNITAIVAPQQFVLRRSKSRPLLLQYQLTLSVLNTDIDALSNGLDGGFLGGILDGITGAIRTIRGYIGQVQGWVNRNLVAPVRGFLAAAARLTGQVVGLARQGSGLIGSVVGVATSVARAGINLFRAAAQVAALPGLAVRQLAGAANTFTQLFCLLKNGLRGGGGYSDWGDLFGASNCSSTAGGRPPSPSTVAGTNPLYDVVPPSGPLPVSITPTAAAGITALANTDVVQQPPTAEQLRQTVTAVSDGLTVAEPDISWSVG